MKDIFNKRQRFSIRKFSVGVASVLIGIALFTPSQGVLASTENSLPSVEKREEVQPIPGNQNNTSSELDTRDVPIGSTRTTEPVTSGDKENNSLTTRASVAGEDRSSTPAVRAASNPSEVKKYELTDEYAKQIKAGVIGSEGNKLDSLLLNGPQLSPEAYTDNDYLKDKEELYIYEKGGKKYVGYNSHPMLEDTDGDGIIDSDEKSDEKLKWNVSERDMIMFMELSYRDDDYIDKVLNNKKQLTEADLYKKKGESKPRYEYMMMNRELAPYWKRKKSYHTSSGLDAVLYETKSDFLYLPNGTAQVLAFRGTSDAKDIVADGVLGVGSNPQQGNDAENIMRELAKDKSITNLYLTGHSLGGYLVQRAMVEAYQLAYSDSRVMSPKEQRAYRNFYNNVLKKGTTFNAPKVVTSWVSRREFWQKGLDSKKIAKSGKMTHYIVDNDSTIRKGVSNDSDVVINVGRTSGGHSSRSYFEADLINRRSEFMSGKRISLDGTGYQDKKITTVKSVEKFGETTVYSKSGDDIIKSTTVSMKDPDTGQITKNTLDEVFKKDGAKAKVVVTPLDPSVRYEKDATRAKEEAKVTVSGTPGTSTVTTTYTVNPNNGEAIAHVGQPVVKQPAIETVVKVAAKDEVEYIKKGADVVKKTTSYTVNSKTGSLTSTEKEEVVNKGGAKDLVEYNSVEPKPVYLKDENSPKGTDTVQFPGKSGKTKVTTTYSVNPVNGTLTPSKSKPEVVTIPIARVVKVGAKDKVEVETIPSPVKYEKDISREKGQDNITVAGKDGSKTTTTTYTVNPNNGEAIAHVGNPVIVNPTETIVKVAAKDKVVETPIEPEVEYVKDVEENFGATSQRTEGKKGKTVTTTTYDVDPKDGHITEHVGNPVVTPAGKTIVKVGAKTKVERSKDDQGREVINTTTYEVDSKTGKVTPTTVTTYGTRKEATVEKKVVPSPVVYEKDDTKEKGTEAITVKGEDGEDTITTTYKVNPTTGEITPSVGKPVRTKEPTNTIVKVPAKDKVDVETIPSPVKYEKDTSREKGQDNITVPGKAGSKTTTTTYTVNPNNGEVTPNVGEPVIVKPTDTIIKVAAKDKVVYSKDGDNIVKEVTTYIVNPTNGNITGHTTKETFKENGLKDKVEVETIPSPVKYEKDTSREKGQDNITVPGKAGSKTTTTTYTLNPNSGEAIAHVGEPVIVNPTTTIVKVAAKDKVVTSKDGNNIVKTATSYTVNPDNGNIIEHTTKETFKENGLKDKVEVETIPSPVKYEKDASRDRGQENITVAGKDGSKTTTTTYTVNPDNGEVTPNVGEPVVVNPTETIVKVAAKDKVVETPIEPEVEYVKDVEKDFGTPDERTEGEKGKTVTTTTYDVDPNDGHITEHVGNPVVSPAGKTIVKVGAKTKVEQSKDSEGRDVIDTTTYEVDPKTGKVTPTTVRTYGKTKAPTVEKRVVPSPVVYEKDDTKEKGTAPTTVKGEDGEDTITTTYTVDPNTGKITASEGQPVRTKEPTNTIVKVAAKDKVETTAIPSPKKYVKDDTRDKDQPNVEEAGQAGSSTTTTTYSVDSTTGAITERVGKPVVVNPTETIVKVAAKDKVVETPIEPEVEYVRDGEREVDTPNERVEGAKGKTVTTTTYDVDPNDGHITEHVGNPVVSPAGKTIVKVGAKTKVEQSKDSEGRDVIDTTTYEVDPKTGKVTPTTVRTYGKTKAPTVEKRVVPSPVVYEKDDTKEKGTAPTTVKGEDGEDTITTTYTVDPNTGKITASEGQPVRTKEPTNTIVKVAAKDKVETTAIPSPKKYVKDDTRDKDQPNVEEAGQAGSSTTTTTYSVDSTTGAITERVGEPVVVNPTETIVKVAAKDKVVETPIEPEVEYVKDVEKDFGTPDERTEGEKGKTVTTTTYDVDPNDGHITEHVGNPVVSPAGKTIVKVGAKTKVEQSKDSEGRDVIDTTTYEVDPKTGKVTPTTVRTYGITKEPKVELEQNPKTGDVTVTPKKPDGSTYPPGTTVEIPGKGDKPITVTIGEDGKGKVPNSELPEGKVPGTGKITEPGKPAVEVPVENPAKVTIFENGVLPASIELPELMIEVRWIDEDGNVLKPSVKTGNEKDAEHGSIPGYEFVRTVIAENEPVMTHIFRKVSGSTHSNPATPPKVTIFENGVLPASIELPELMIEVRWIDEDGNVLKPSVKTGNEKDAEHRSIPGYEFVRTVISENEPVMTHIFRKVSSNTNTIPVTPDTNVNSGHDTPELTTPTPIPVVPVMPDANGNSGQDTAAPTTSVPDAVAPNADQVDTKTTNDNGAKSNDSQNVLPNTGTESNAALASLGLLGMLGGLGLALAKKKED